MHCGTWHGAAYCCRQCADGTGQAVGTSGIRTRWGSGAGRGSRLADDALGFTWLAVGTSVFRVGDGAARRLAGGTLG